MGLGVLWGWGVLWGCRVLWGWRILWGWRRVVEKIDFEGGLEGVLWRKEVWGMFCGGGRFGGCFVEEEGLGGVL